MRSQSLVRGDDPWTYAKCVDGPKLYAWLAERGYVDRLLALDGTERLWEKRFDRWRAGGRVDIWIADEALTLFGRTLAEALPDDWFYASLRRPRR